jgi:hypothetical protein
VVREEPLEVRVALYLGILGGEHDVSLRGDRDTEGAAADRDPCQERRRRPALRHDAVLSTELGAVGLSFPSSLVMFSSKVGQ